MNKTFRRFVDCLEHSQDTTDLCNAMSEAAATYGLCAFNYFWIFLDDPKRPPVFLSTYPQGWIGRYIDARYDRVDPIVPRIEDTLLPFKWGTADSVRGLSEAQRQIVDEARKFGLPFRLVVPLRARHGRISAISFACDRREKDFLGLAERHRHELHLMALHFHERALHTVVTDSAPISLSPRESECLQWAARGKTRWEIAGVLGISHRTAVFHLENAKRKLAVHSTTHAVAKAIRLGCL